MLILILFINPILSLILYLNLKNKIKHYFYLSLLLAIIGMGMPITENFDLLRHFYRYENVNTSMNIGEYLKDKIDFLIYIIYYYGNKFNIKKEFMTLIMVFISYFYFFKIYYLIKIKNKFLSNENILFFLFSISIQFSSVVYGLRSTAAVAVFLYGIFLFFEENKKRGIIFIIFSNFIHFMTILFTICFIITMLLRIKTKFFRYIFCICILFIFIKINFIQYVIEIINMLIFNKESQKMLDIYINGYWGREYLKDRSFKGMVYIYILNIKYVWLFFYLLRIKVKEEKNKLKNFTYLLGSIMFLLFPLPKLRERYMDLPYILTALLFIKDSYQNNKIVKKVLYVFLIVSTTLFLVDLYRIRSAIPGGLLKLFMPTIYNLIYDSISYSNWIEFI